MKNKNISNLQNNKSGQYNLADKCNHVVVTDINQYKMKKHRVSGQTIFLSILLILIFLLIIQNSLSIEVGYVDPFTPRTPTTTPSTSTTTTTPTTPTTTPSTPEVFDLKKVNTWHLDWAQIKTNLKSNANNIPEKWSAATPADRLTSISNLIKKTQSQVKLTNLESSQLTLKSTPDGKAVLTNGQAQLDLENLPSELKELKYDEQEKAFIYTFKESKITIRNGILNPDFSITGTGWPSDGLKWNQRGEFHQTSDRVSLTGDSKITLGNMEITKARKNQEAFAIFRPGDKGNNYVRGTNLDVSIKDSQGNPFARVITPPKIETEVFVGDNPSSSSSNQYVQLSEDGKKINIQGQEISAETLTGRLTDATVDGDKIIIKNKDILYRIQEKNGKSITEMSKKPGAGESIDIKNMRDPSGSGNVVTQNIPNPFEGDASLVTAPELSQDTPPVTTPPTTTTQRPTIPTTGRPTTTTTTTTTTGGRVRIMSGRVKLSSFTFDYNVPLWGSVKVADMQFTLSDQEASYLSNPSQLPDTSPRRLTLQTARDLETKDFTGSLPRVLATFVTQKIPGSIKEKSIITIYSEGRGSGTASIKIYSPNRQIIGEQSFSGQNAEQVINYINQQYKKKYG